jgi:hypothetical protein
VTWFGIAAWLIVERPFGISFAIPSALSTRLSTFLVFLGRLGVIFILCGWVLPMSTGLWMLIKSRR